MRVTRTKTFNGKRYILWNIERSKAEARKTADVLRRSPWSARGVRIVQVDKGRWAVYYRD